MKRQGILFVRHYSTNARFILNDRDILKTQFDVDDYVSSTKKNFTSVFSIIRQFFYHLFHLHKHQLYFIWFADYHSFIPVLAGKLFGKKTVIVAGGYDATNIPEIDCGAFSETTFKKKLRNHAVRFSLKNADKILPVDDSLVTNENSYIYSDIPGKENLKDGILHFIPEVRDRIEVVYTGFDEKFFERDESIPKEDLVMSAGYSPNDNEFRRKGFDMLIEAARVLPHVNFVIVGLNPEQLRRLSELKLKNVELLSSLKMEELKKYYNRAKVFAQLSMFEGQPNSLCEAMMLECIPVGSNVNGIPRVIGETGFIVDKKDVREISDKITAAMNSPLEKGKKARTRIMENFSYEKRKQRILKVMSELIRY